MKEFFQGAVIAFTVVVSLGVSTAVSAQSLTDALIAAYTNSATLKAQRAVLRSTDEGVAQAIAAKRPTLAASLTSSFTGSTSANILGKTSTTSTSLALSSTLTLWDGGSSDLAIEIAKLSVAVGRDGLIDTEQSVLLAAVTAFMDMRGNAAFLQLAENNLRVLNRQVQASKDRFEVGEARRTDVNLAEAAAAAALANLALRQGTLEISRAAYFTATGTYPGVLKTPPALPRVPTSLDSAIALGQRNHPAVLQAQKAAKIAQLNVYRAEAAMKPSLTASGSLSRTESSANVSGLTLSITGTMPISQGGRLTSLHRQAIALHEQSLANVQLAGLQVKQAVTAAFAQLQIARASITAQQKQVRASRVALRGIREEADLGARTTLDVLNAEQDLVTAESNLVDAKRNEYVAVYSLLSAMGLLTVEHLGLGLKTYNPKTNYNKVSTAPGPTDRGKMLDKIFKRAGKK